jgi:hypothetical protein
VRAVRLGIDAGIPERMTEPEDRDDPEALHQAPEDVVEDDDTDVFTETAAVTPQDGPPAP